MANTDEGIVSLSHGLSLVPSYSLDLKFFRKEVSSPVIDEWELKETLSSLMKREAGLSLTNPRLLKVQKLPDLQKLRKEDAVATGDLTILGVDGIDASSISKAVHGALDGAQLRVGSTKLICQALLSAGTTCDSLQESWQRAFGEREDDYDSTDAGKRPDTLHLTGIPPRWLAEPSLSSNPSVQVAQALFSVLGDVRKVEIVGTTDIGKLFRKVSISGDASLASQLTCQVYVQFQTFHDFKNAAKALSGKVLMKDGSSLVGSYRLEVECNDYFSEMNVRGRKFERMRLEEEERRRDLIRQRKAELARLEKERQEAEERERMLRLQEEKLRKEEEEARRREEERIKMEEARRAEEERIRQEEEARLAEIKRREEVALRKAEEEKRMRAELAARLEKEKMRIQEEAERREREQREREQTLRRRLQDRALEARERDRQQRKRREAVAGEKRFFRHSGDEDDRHRSEDDRWRMEVTQSQGQEDSLRQLSIAVPSGDIVVEEDGSGGNGDLSSYLRKRIRSIVVAVTM